MSSKIKHIFLIIAFSLCSLFTKAQSEDKPEATKGYTSREARTKFVWGGKFGLNHSNVYDAQGMDFVADTKNGFAGGLFAIIPLGGVLGLQPELLISQKGFSGSGTINNDGYTLTRTSTFLDVPLQLQLKPFRFFSFVGGIQYSYLIKQNDEFVYSNNSVQQSEEFKNDNIRRNIFGGVAGFDINIRHIVLSARTGWDVYTNRGDGSSYTPRYKNIWLQGTIGYRFY